MDTGISFLFIGQLPTWLQGILLRNGPGMHTIGDTKYNHWFDGLALLHSFTFKNGKLLHIRLKKAQQPKSWCLMLLILFWVWLECCRFRLQSGMCGEVITTLGSLSKERLTCRSPQQRYLCRAVIRDRLYCPFFWSAEVQYCLHCRIACNQLWAGHCRAAFAFHPEQENLPCFKLDQPKVL